MNTSIMVVGGICGGILILALGIAGIILLIKGVRDRKQPGGSSTSLIIGIICLVLGACLACSMLAYWAWVAYNVM